MFRRNAYKAFIITYYHCLPLFLFIIHIRLPS